MVTALNLCRPWVDFKEVSSVIRAPNCSQYLPDCAVHGHTVVYSSKKAVKMNLLESKNASIVFPDVCA